MQNGELLGAVKLYLWSLSYIKKYWFKAVIFIVIMFITSAVSLVMPKFIQYFIDHVLPNRDFSDLYWLTTALIILILLMIGLQIISNIVQKEITEHSLQDLRMDIFRKLREVGYPFFEKNTTGQLLQTFSNEVKAITDIYQRYLPRAINLVFLTIISLVMVIQINPLLSLVFVPSILLYNLFGKKFAKKAALYGRETRDKHRHLHGNIYNFLSGVVELRNTNRTEWIRKDIADQFRSLMHSSNKEMFWLQSRGTARKSIISYGQVVVFIFGILLVKSGSITVGEFIAFVFYYDLVISRVTILISNITEQRVLLYQIEKVYEKMQLDPYIVEDVRYSQEKQLATGVTFSHVSFHYENGLPILKDLNIKINAGERVALVGESGSGKSTIFKLMVRFYDPTGGSIQIGDVSIKDLSFQRLRESIGCVFQETYLFGSTIRENICFGKPIASESEMIAAAKAAFIHDFIISLPNGYDTQVGERGYNLSGGQRQRIAIARIFLKNPPIVLLDEATSALDNISELEVLKAIDELLKGRTTITIAHRLSTVRHYDRIIVLKSGQIAEEGTYEQLMELKQAYYALEKRGGLQDEVLEHSQ